jgi:hypothetical protein
MFRIPVRQQLVIWLSWFRILISSTDPYPDSDTSLLAEILIPNFSERFCTYCTLVYFRLELTNLLS